MVPPGLRVPLPAALHGTRLPSRGAWCWGGGECAAVVTGAVPRPSIAGKCRSLGKLGVALFYFKANGPAALKPSRGSPKSCMRETRVFLPESSWGRGKHAQALQAEFGCKFNLGEKKLNIALLVSFHPPEKGWLLSTRLHGRKFKLTEGNHLLPEAALASGRVIGLTWKSPRPVRARWDWDPLALLAGAACSPGTSRYRESARGGRTWRLLRGRIL